MSLAFSLLLGHAHFFNAIWFQHSSLKDLRHTLGILIRQSEPELLHGPTKLRAYERVKMLFEILNELCCVIQERIKNGQQARLKSFLVRRIYVKLSTFINDVNRTEAYQLYY